MHQAVNFSDRRTGVRGLFGSGLVFPKGIVFAGDLSEAGEKKVVWGDPQAKDHACAGHPPQELSSARS
jgi:hypothetical protein